MQSGKSEVVVKTIKVTIDDAKLLKYQKRSGMADISTIGSLQKMKPRAANKTIIATNTNKMCNNLPKIPYMLRIK